ncbi:hypothetical protein C8Q70DRAFT_934188 [Cubamyces menziesii]|nr:hypothetical protein C8Q70DRAFT_934188 [Cubamyces menziesii]
MALPSLSPHFVNVQHVHTSDTVPTLRHHSSANAFYDVGTHSCGSSRPSSSSSSNSSYASPESAPDSSASSYAAPSRSASWSSLSAEPCPPSYSTCPGSLRRPRPLPTPPATPQHVRAAVPLRPLPRPPLGRSHSDSLPPPSTPLPAPPTARAPPPAAASSASSPQLVEEPEADPSAISPSPVPKVVIAPSDKAVGRPSIQIDIPRLAQKSSASAPQITLELTPLSPIAFNFPGPRELRKRREDELSRRMKDLGFVEEIPPSPPPKDAGVISKSTRAHTGRHTPGFSISGRASEDDRDVVLLMECSSDSETEELPKRNDSLAAMLTLFPDADCTPSPTEPCPRASKETAVDVQVEVVSKKATARTKRRFSRKWVREKSGKRWTEKDFSEILSELRKLR